MHEPHNLFANMGPEDFRTTIQSVMLGENDSILFAVMLLFCFA